MRETKNAFTCTATILTPDANRHPPPADNIVDVPNAKWANPTERAYTSPIWYSQES